MSREIVVQATRPRPHELFQPRWRPGVAGLQSLRVDKQALAQVLPKGRLPLGFGEAPQAHQIVVLHTIEVVLSLRVDHPEDRVRGGMTSDVRDTPVITRDRDSGGPRHAISMRTDARRP